MTSTSTLPRADAESVALAPTSPLAPGKWERATNGAGIIVGLVAAAAFWLPAAVVVL